MKKLILAGYKAYYASVSTMLPKIASSQALKLLFTVRKPSSPPSCLPVAPEKILLKSSNAHLSIWKGNSNKTALLIHGWNGDLTQFTRIFDALREREYTIYGIHPRAHGPSRYTMSHPGFFIEAVTEASVWLGKNFDIAIGHSMGAGALGCVSSTVNIAKSLVLISSPASFLDVISRFASALSLTGRAKPLFHIDVENYVGLGFEALEVHQLLGRSNIPSLLVHDVADKQVPFSDAKKLFDANDNAHLLPMQNTGHTKILGDAKTVSQIFKWVDKQASQTEADVA